MVATLDRLLDVFAAEGVVAPVSSPMPQPMRPPPIPPRLHVVAAPAAEQRHCRICGHIERAHTPACYVAGCVCRRWVAPR